MARALSQLRAAQAAGVCRGGPAERSAARQPGPVPAAFRGAGGSGGRVAATAGRLGGGGRPGGGGGVCELRGGGAQAGARLPDCTGGGPAGAVGGGGACGPQRGGQLRASAHHSRRGVHALPLVAAANDAGAAAHAGGHPGQPLCEPARPVQLRGAQRDGFPQDPEEARQGDGRRAQGGAAAGGAGPAGRQARAAGSGARGGDEPLRHARL
mmetsp:Transcript_45797/g.115810  ORF Transcript_45797/g.115810 Transcript_45797/m.115810 type:complete len:211 (-) Transcript_45797:1753-2385(-)